MSREILRPPAIFLAILDEEARQWAAFPGVSDRGLASCLARHRAALAARAHGPGDGVDEEGALPPEEVLGAS